MSEEVLALGPKVHQAVPLHCLWYPTMQKSRRQQCLAADQMPSLPQQMSRSKEHSSEATVLFQQAS